MNESAFPPARLQSTKEARITLGVSARTLWAITAPRGPLPVVKIGTRCLYDPVDLAKYIEGQKTKGGTV
jgi:hypothetical protein